MGRPFFSMYLKAYQVDQEVYRKNKPDACVSNAAVCAQRCTRRLDMQVWHFPEEGVEMAAAANALRRAV